MKCHWQSKRNGGSKAAVGARGDPADAVACGSVVGVCDAFMQGPRRAWRVPAPTHPSQEGRNLSLLVLHASTPSKHHNSLRASQLLPPETQRVSGRAAAGYRISCSSHGSTCAFGLIDSFTFRV